MQNAIYFWSIFELILLTCNTNIQKSTLLFRFCHNSGAACLGAFKRLAVT